MTITPVAHDLDLMPAHQAPRAEGLHISDIYNALYKELEPARFGGEGGPNTLKMAMGLAWETYLEGRLADAGIDAARPPEFKTSEGIAFNPDLLIFNGQDRVGEIKLTYMSEAPTLSDPKFGKWLVQAKAYCYHLGIPRARFYVLFVNGDYKASRDPVFRAYDIAFTQQDLAENWQMLMNFARHRKML
jgi:hypothetical protein